MKMIITGRKVQITDGIRTQLEKKLAKLDKFFKTEPEAKVTLSVHKNGQMQIVEVTVIAGGMMFRAEESSNDMYVAIDEIVDVIERQIRKNKTKIARQIRSGELVPIIEPVQDEEVEAFEIVRTKRHTIKPMSAEEAILQMNLLGHQFFVFKNAETDESNVVYRRKNGGYGLIELS